jgi:SAM-dependent methyltransferase
MALTAEQRARTLERFERHRRAWDENPALRTLYADWYARVAAALPPASLGPRLEIGSGPGFARAFIPDLVLSDLVRAPWHDREVSAEALPFAEGSLGALVLFDVLHHLPSPRRFFEEAVRVLRPGGRIVMCEPYMSGPSYTIYKLFHEEPIALGGDPLADQNGTGADADADATVGRDPFDSNQAIPTLLFGRARAAFEAAFPALSILSVDHLAGLSYPASGGFSRRPFLPLPAWSMLHRIEARLPKAVTRWLAFRMLVTIERR